ncbi:MAG: hypothetical protein ACRDZY_14160, partial [Acidimicrobiales bacterium]
MTRASQAIRRATSALIGPPSPSDAAPIRPCNTARVTVTTTRGRSPTLSREVTGLQCAVGEFDQGVGVALRR